MMYSLHLKNLPGFCVKHFYFHSLVETKNFLAIMPGLVLDSLYKGEPGNFKLMEIPKIKRGTDDFSIWEVEHLSANRCWRTWVCYAVLDGCDTEENFLRLVSDSWDVGDYHPEILKIRKLYEGEFGKQLNLERNLKTGECGKRIPSWDRPWLEIPHGLFQKRMHELLKPLRDEPGTVMFRHGCWQGSYAKNIGDGRFELVEDETQGSGEHKDLQRRIGTFEEAVKHIVADDFMDLLDLDGDPESYILHNVQVDQKTREDGSQINSFRGYFDASLDYDGDKLTAEIINRDSGEHREFYGHKNGFMKWFIGKAAREEAFDVFVTTPSTGERMKMDEVMVPFGKELVPIIQKKNGTWGVSEK